MKLRRLLPALVLIAAVTAAAAQPPRSQPNETASQSVSCYRVKDEGQAMLSAPHGARRISEHDLEVRYKSGARRFVDPKPYREELSGTAWEYCGYVPLLKAHLLGLDQGDFFSGKLLLDDSGVLIDAGNTVYPSPDGKLFVAAQIQNGEYLEDWKILNRAGKVLWAGKGGLETGQGIQAEYGEPNWISGDVFEVAATCNDGTEGQGKATFTVQGKSGRWTNDLKCRSKP